MQHDEENQPRTQLNLSHSSLREYNVTLSSGETIYILARNSEEAAWHALELAGDRSLKLVDVRLTDEWELPADVSCLIRTTHLETKKTKEFVYKRRHAAENKVRKLMSNEMHEFIVCTHEAIQHVHPNNRIDDDE